MECGGVQTRKALAATLHSQKQQPNSGPDAAPRGCSVEREGEKKGQFLRFSCLRAEQPREWGVQTTTTRGENKYEMQSSCCGCATPNVNTLDPESQGAGFAAAFVMAIERGREGGFKNSKKKNYLPRAARQRRLRKPRSHRVNRAERRRSFFFGENGGEVLQRDAPSSLPLSK